MKSFLGVSIRAHGRLFGGLYLTEKQGAEEFSEVDAEIVAALAAQAGTILERGLLIEQLKSAEARHRHILESAAEGIYGLDLDGTCTFINKAGAAMLGYRPEEIIGRRMHSLVHHTRPDGSPYPEEECPTERSRRHGRPSHLIEDSYWRKDGTSFPVQLFCAPILSDGALRGAVVTFFDTTERKEAERRKALDHGIMRAVIESATVDEANQKILQTVCEVLGWEWSAVWQVDKQANVLRCMTNWHRPEISVPEFEAATCRITFAPGVGLPGRVWSSGRTTYISDVTRDPNFPRAAVAARSGFRSGFAFPIYQGSNVIGVMEFFSREPREPSRDVLNVFATLGAQIGLRIERKQTNDSLQLFRTLLNQATDAVEVMDPATARFIDCNTEAYSCLGFTRAEFLSLTVPDIDPNVPLPVFLQYMARFREAPEGGSMTIESVHRRKDGSTFPVEVNCRLIRLDREYALAIARDITERRQAEDAVRQVPTRLLQAQEEERKRIAREIHDELGQQLTLLRFALVKLANAGQQPAADLRTQARALTQPVDKMIDTVRRIATTLRPAILDDLGLQAALEWLVTDFRARTGIVCETSLAPPPSQLDDTRAITLFRILQEALTNVARHAQATSVTIRLQRTAEALALEVRDNGRGLTEAQQTSPAAIGLLGMQERALLMGGKVTIEGRPNEGTTVTARIPIRNG